MWLIKFAFICVTVSYSFVSVSAQSSWLEWNEGNADEGGPAFQEEEYERLSELAAHPFNINTITKEELEQLPFLSDSLIEHILYYVYKYGPLLSLNELWGVEGMDWQTNRFLRDFIYIGPSGKSDYRFSFKHFLKYNKQELLTRVDIPLNRKAGYASYSAEYLADHPNKKYEGSPLYHNFRYRMEYQKKGFVGVSAEKDAGEPFFSKYNRKGYDFYSAFLFLQDIGRIKALALGDYRACFGYGLVMNQGNFTMGKLDSPLAMNRLGRGISRYSSLSEYGYFRGMATTLRLGERWEWSVMYAFNRLDASVENSFITSLKTDGFHRLKKEEEKRNTVTNNMISSNLYFNTPRLKTGITVVYNIFNKVLNPSFRPYNRYYPRGDRFYNAGIYYKYFFGRFAVSGETAVDKKGRVATLSQLTYSPSVHTSWLFIHRFYDKKYQSIYGKAFGENSKLQNEIGSYIGLETSGIKNIRFLGYMDFFHFFYRKFQVDKDHTSGMEGGCRISYSPDNSLMMLIKYTCKNKPKNLLLPSQEKYVMPHIRHRIQFQTHYALHSHWLLKSKGEYVHTSYGGNRPADGWLINGGVRWQGKQWQLDGSGAYFSTSSFDARVYMYEPGLLYVFSMPSFSGRGYRVALNLRYAYKKCLVFQGKWGWTHYGDRNRIGTGLEAIQGNDKADLQFLLKLKW